MEIINLTFEQPISVSIDGKIVEIVVFKTAEHGNVKFGVKAPKTVKVHREEIHHAIKEKEQHNLLALNCEDL